MQTQVQGIDIMYVCVVVGGMFENDNGGGWMESSTLFSAQHLLRTEFKARPPGGRKKNNDSCLHFVLHPEKRTFQMLRNQSLCQHKSSPSTPDPVRVSLLHS